MENQHFQNFGDYFVLLKALMPITFSSPIAQPEVVYILISDESPYFQIQNFSFKFFVVLQI